MVRKNIFSIKTSGIYVEKISLLPPSVAQVETAISAFIGYTQTAKDHNGLDLTDNPTKISSLKEYEDFFGAGEHEKGIEVSIERKTENGKVVLKSAVANFKRGTKPSLHIMYNAMRLFFDNGGGSCYIVSIGKSNSEALIDHTKLQRGLDVLANVDEPTLIVFPEGQGIDNSANYYSLIASALKQCADLRDRFCIIDVYKQETTTSDTIANFRTGLTTNDNLNFGAAYYPNLKTSFNYAVNESETDVNICLDNGPILKVKLSELKGKIVANKLDIEIYNTAITAIQKLNPVLPPSSAIAGVYDTVDRTRGVWKAPANISINSIIGITDIIDDAKQTVMNIDPVAGKSVNAIRTFSGKGILVWGARTLKGNDNEWRYISVKRFFIMVEESVKKSTAWVVFEPNDANTWIKVSVMIENYLTILWRNGALQGSKPDHAFYVKCGLGQTMTAQDIIEGRLIVELGMAAVRPAEFITLRIMHKIQVS